MELFTKSMPLVPTSYPSQRVLKIGTENRSEIIGDLVAAHLQVALGGLVSNCYYTGKRVKVSAETL